LCTPKGWPYKFEFATAWQPCWMLQSMPPPGTR